MIFKIQSNFSNNLADIIEILSKKYEVMFYNNNLYASCLSEISTIVELKPKKNFYITEINEINLEFEPKTVVDWCKNQFINIDLRKYEIEQQDRLSHLMSVLEKVEITLLNNKIQ